MKRFLSLALICTLLSACNTLTSGDTRFVAKLGVTYAVIKVTERHPERGPRIVEIAREVKVLAGQNRVDSVDMLIVSIRSLIKWENLTASDILLVNLLLDEIRNILLDRVGPNTLPADKLLLVSEVASWVESAALNNVPPAK